MNIQNLDLGILLGVLGILVSLVVYRDEMKKKLDLLIAKHDRALTRGQAQDLMGLYLEAVNARIQFIIRRYAANDLRAHYTAGDIEGIKSELRRAYQTVVVSELRPKLARFRLSGGKTFESLIAEVGQAKINSTIDEMGAAFSQGVSASRSLDDILRDITRKAEEANRYGVEKMRSAIDEHYKNVVDE